MGKLIIDGKSVYEVDENCLRKRRIPKECDIYQKLAEMDPTNVGKGVRPNKDSVNLKKE